VASVGPPPLTTRLLRLCMQLPGWRLRVAAASRGGLLQASGWRWGVGGV